jgi:hypothetical protein
MQLRQAETRDRQVEKLKAQIRAAMDSSDAAWKLVQPVKHCKELLAIREPNRSILLISRAVLKMLEVEPRSRKSRKGIFSFFRRESACRSLSTLSLSLRHPTCSTYSLI